MEGEASNESSCKRHRLPPRRKRNMSSMHAEFTQQQPEQQSNTVFPSSNKSRNPVSPLISFLAHIPLEHRRPNVIGSCNPQKCSVSTASLKPANVGIAGAGIAGLSTALTLLKTPNTGVERVTIFEPRETVDEGQGAALNINGAAAILLQYGVPLWEIANPMKSVIARTAAGAPLFTLDIGQALSRSPRARDLLTVDDKPAFMTVMRDQLQAMLVEELSNFVQLRRGKNNLVTGVEASSSGGHFIFADGSITEDYDLLIGADGLRSNVRMFVAGGQSSPRYTGLRVQWAVTAPGPVTLPVGVVEQWFGDGCYVLRYVAGSSPRATEMLAISFQDRRSAGENASYADSDLREEIGKRLIRAGMPEEVLAVFHRAERFIETGVYQHKVLSNWMNGGCCTLVGDAAHAMPPHLGQGANQAVQDAQALAIAMSNIGSVHNDLADALSSYERIRRVPVEAILQTSRAVGLIETQGGPLGQALRNNFFRILGISGGVERVFLQTVIPHTR